MFGWSKSFVIVLFISILIGIGTKNWKNAAIILGAFAGVRLIWKILT
jgi:hypothetical protein